MKTQHRKSEETSTEEIYLQYIFKFALKTYLTLK